MSLPDRVADPNDMAQAIAVPERPRRVRRVVAGCLALPFLGLGVMALAVERTPLADGYAGPKPVPAAVAERFRYPEQGTPVKVVADFEPHSFDDHSTHWLKLEVTTPGHDPHVAQVIHYRPKGDQRRPAVIVSPILGGSNEVAKIIAEGLVARGLHAAIVLRAQSYLDSSRGPEALEVALRTAVLDRRRTIDWLQEQPDVDPEQIGAIGVSVGGLATTILAAIEPRVKASVFVMAGGDLSTLIPASDQPRVQRYVRERDDHGQAPGPLAAGLAAGVPSDPLQLAPYVDARRCLAVVAARDTTVPVANQELLHRALGGPERITLPTGHYTTALYLPYLQEACLGFLQAKLGG